MAGPWTSPDPLTNQSVTKSIYITELQTCVNDRRAELGDAALSFIDQSVGANIKLPAIEELKSNTAQLALDFGYAGGIFHIDLLGRDWSDYARRNGDPVTSNPIINDLRQVLENLEIQDLDDELSLPIFISQEWFDYTREFPSGFTRMNGNWPTQSGEPRTGTPDQFTGPTTVAPGPIFDGTGYSATADMYFHGSDIVAMTDKYLLFDDPPNFVQEEFSQKMGSKGQQGTGSDALSLPQNLHDVMSEFTGRRLTDHEYTYTSFYSGGNLHLRKTKIDGSEVIETDLGVSSGDLNGGLQAISTTSLFFMGDGNLPGGQAVGVMSKTAGSLSVTQIPNFLGLSGAPTGTGEFKGLVACDGSSFYRMYTETAEEQILVSTSPDVFETKHYLYHALMTVSGGGASPNTVYANVNRQLPNGVDVVFHYGEHNFLYGGIWGDGGFWTTGSDLTPAILEKDVDTRATKNFTFNFAGSTYHVQGTTTYSGPTDNTGTFTETPQSDWNGNDIDVNSFIDCRKNFESKAGAGVVPRPSDTDFVVTGATRQVGDITSNVPTVPHPADQNFNVLTGVHDHILATWDHIPGTYRYELQIRNVSSGGWSSGGDTGKWESIESGGSSFTGAIRCPSDTGTYVVRIVGITPIDARLAGPEFGPFGPVVPDDPATNIVINTGPGFAQVTFDHAVAPDPAITKYGYYYRLQEFIPPSTIVQTGPFGGDQDNPTDIGLATNFVIGGLPDFTTGDWGIIVYIVSGNTEGWGVQAQESFPPPNAP